MPDSVLTSEERKLRGTIETYVTQMDKLRERNAELITEQAEGNREVERLEDYVDTLERRIISLDDDLKESQHEALDRLMKIGVLSAERDIWRNNCFTLQAQNVTNEAQKRSGIAQNAPLTQKGFKDGE